MVEINKALEEARRTEKETYAINNFFKLISQANVANLAQMPEKTFKVIGGYETLETLLIDVKNENIDIFTNTMRDLFLQLEHNIKRMDEVTWTKSFFTEQAKERYELYKSFYSKVCSVERLAYEDLASLQVISEEKILELLEYKPRERN